MVSIIVKFKRVERFEEYCTCRRYYFASDALRDF